MRGLPSTERTFPAIRLGPRRVWFCMRILMPPLWPATACVHTPPKDWLVARLPDTWRLLDTRFQVCDRAWHRVACVAEGVQDQFRTSTHDRKFRLASCRYTRRRGLNDTHKTETA